MKKLLLSLFLFPFLPWYIMFAQITINVDLLPSTTWTINPLIFGTFSEEHWGDLVPAIYEQYIVNPSFEEWYDNGKSEWKTQIVWNSIKAAEGVAYPWEKRVYNGSPVFEKVEDPLNSKYAQRISVATGEKAAILQRLPLPDYRTLNYNVSFYAKSTGSIDLKLIFQDLYESKSLSTTSVTNISSEWKKFDFNVDLTKSAEKWMNRYGIYNMAFVVEGNGTLFLDQAVIFPDDCVESIYNPETLDNFRNLNVKMIRWPGGNFTSGYHWYSGIGPLIERPVETNRAWNGLNINHLGTDEFLRFCELADIVPVMGVGFGEITAKEVADWVEYCNGDISTPMGALRNSNGRVEPYNVKYWGVGNEVYGTYQIGHTDSKTYARGLVEMSKAMRERDPDIVVIASGYGMHNTYNTPNSTWNQDVFEIAGDYFEMFDTHLYVYGPSVSQAEAASKETMFRAFVAGNFFMRDYIERLKETINLKDSKKEHKLALLEWGVLPRTSTNQTPGRQTFANLLCSSVMYNEMMRQGDFIQMTAHHNFSYYVQPVGGHAEPLNPRTVLFEYNSQLSDGKVLDITTESMPIYKVTQDYQSKIGRAHV